MCTYVDIKDMKNIFNLPTKTAAHTLNGEDVILLESPCRAENLTAVDSAVLGFNVCDPV